MVRKIRQNYHLKPLHDRLREAGVMTMNEIAEELDVSTVTVKTWRHAGLLPAHRYSDKNEFLYG